jgi:hypothetical protein
LLDSKRHAMPCHHNLEEYLTGYLDGASLRDDPKGPLFRTDEDETDFYRGQVKLIAFGLVNPSGLDRLMRRPR